MITHLYLVALLTLFTSPLFAEQETDIDKLTEALKLLTTETSGTAKTKVLEKPIEKKDFAKIFATYAQYLKDRGSKDPRITAIVEKLKQNQKPLKE